MTNSAFPDDRSRCLGDYCEGINPRTRLNLGDCASYALVKSLDAPLPFKGDDFRETDVAVAE